MKNKKRLSDLLLESARWRMLGLLFECPSGNWKKDVADLAAEVEDDRLKRAAEYAQTEASEGLYHATFGPGGPAPPREVTYRSWVQPGYLLSELSAYYREFGYRPNSPDPPDHVSIETGFVAYLKLKEAFADMVGDDTNAAITAIASERFVSEHVAKFAGDLATLLKNSGMEYLSLAGNLLFEMAGKDPAPVRRSLPTIISEEEESFTCGSHLG